MRIAIAVLLASSSLAQAKPLPAGMKVVVKNGHLQVVKPAGAVPLFGDMDSRATQLFQTVKSATLSDDGKTLIVNAEGCMQSADEAMEIPLGEVDARFENVTGMTFHLKKQYGDAIAHFSVAAKSDPSVAMYATNLLSAQSLGGKLDDADQTLATYGPKNVAWFGWRLAVDSDLKALRGRPSTKPFVPAKATKIALEGDHQVAVSPLGLVASTEWVVVGMAPASGVDLAIYDLKANQLLMRLPLVSMSDACLEKPPADLPPEMRMPCTKDALARTATHVRAASEILGSLGFAKIATTWTDVRDSDKPIAIDKSLTVLFKDDGVEITHGKSVTKAKVDVPRAIGWGGGVLVFQHRQGYMCGGADSMESASDVVAVP